MIRKDKRSGFGGKLGDEINELWAAIAANQIIPANGMEAKQTSSGTVLAPPKPDQASEATSTNGTQVFELLLTNQAYISGVTTAGGTTMQSGGYTVASKPWFQISTIDGIANCLLQPITYAEFKEAEALWGTAQTWKSLIQTGMAAPAYGSSEWASLIFPKPQYIGGYQESGKWDARVGMLNAVIVHDDLMAMPLEHSLPAVTFTDYGSGDVVTLPEIKWIEVHSYRRWIPSA